MKEYFLEVQLSIEAYLGEMEPYMLNSVFHSSGSQPDVVGGVGVHDQLKNDSAKDPTNIRVENASTSRVESPFGFPRPTSPCRAWTPTL